MSCPRSAPTTRHPPQFLQLPAITPLPAATVTRPLALIEKMAMGRRGRRQEVEGPVEALLGTVDVDGYGWSSSGWTPVTENPAVGATEVWEFYNTTADAHPMHVHEVAFEVVNREGLLLDEDGEVVQPSSSTATSPRRSRGRRASRTRSSPTPARSRASRRTFTTPGQFVWHCHIVEHEDNEMMRPYRIGPPQPGQPGS